MVIRPLDSAPPSSATAAGGVAVVTDDHRESAAAATVVAPPSLTDVKAAVDTANAALAAMNRSLEFSIDPDTKVVIVRLIDNEDNQVLRQVPSQEMLEIAKSIDQWQGALLRRQA